MNLDDSEDQNALSDLVRSICKDHCTTAVVRQMENDRLGYPEALWRQFVDAGLTATLIPEEFGGSPISMLDNAAIHEQLGMALAPTPLFVSSVISVLALQASEQSEVQQELLPGMARGEIVVSPAWLEPGGGCAESGVQLRHTIRGEAFCLNGSKRHVFYAEAANKFLVLARDAQAPDAVDLFLVDREAPGLTLRREANMASDAQYLVHFENVGVEARHRLTEGGRGWALWESVMAQAIILDAAYAVGLARRALEITVEYAGERTQFDKPLAAFQSISHYLADDSTALDGARVLVYEAAWAHSQGERFRTLAAMARLFACRTARDITARAQQIHGGIGFTLDYDIQLFFRRAKQQQVNWWDSRYLEEIIARAVLDERESPAVADPFLRSA